MEKYKKLCALEAIFWIPNVLKRFMEGFRLHSATSISKKCINLANFLGHLTRFNSKEDFTTTLVTTQKLIVMQQIENTRENVQYRCGFSDILGLQLSA